MNRDRSYYRKMRAKHIRRKKKISQRIYYYGWGYEHDGMYSKGKIHCSCPCCSPKTRNKGRKRLLHGNYATSLNYKHSDMCKILSMEDELREFAKVG